MKKHFVVFLSPGTFVAESNTKEIDSWDVEKAKEMVKEIKQRYNAVPYCFYFITRTRNDDDLDSKVTKTSPTYYLGGKHGRLFTLDEIKAKKDPEDKILISNMEINNYDRVYQTTEGWKWTQPFGKEDILIEV